MNFRPFALSAFALVLASCDKAKNLADTAAKTVKQELASAGESSESTADPELMKLVDQNAEGVLFRKDLPFPSRLDVRIRRVDDLSVRMMQASEIGRQNGMVKGIREQVFKLERAGDQVRVTEERSEFSVPSVDDPEVTKKAENPLERSLILTNPSRSGKTARNGVSKTAAISAPPFWKRNSRPCSTHF